MSPLSSKKGFLIDSQTTVFDIDSVVLDSSSAVVPTSVMDGRDQPRVEEHSSLPPPPQRVDFS